MQTDEVNLCKNFTSIKTYVASDPLNENIRTDMDKVAFSFISKEHIFVAFIVLAIRDLPLLWRCSKTILCIANSEDTKVGDLPIVGANVDGDFLPFTKDLVPDRPTVTSRSTHTLVAVVMVSKRVVSGHHFAHCQGNGIDASIVHRYGRFLGHATASQKQKGSKDGYYSLHHVVVVQFCATKSLIKNKKVRLG